jgi:hypothetical protein
MASSLQAQPSMDSIIDLNANDAQSELTSLYSGETPTLPSNKAPTIKALLRAADDSEYNLCVARIPRDHKIRISRVWYIRYDPYRPKRSVRKAWYWGQDQSEELIRVTKGMELLFLVLTK